MRTFKVELKQKQKFKANVEAKTGFEGEKGEKQFICCHFIQKHLERKREKVWERKERKEEEEEKEGEGKEEEIGKKI